MYYSVDFYPQLSAELAESIAAMRKEYDPTCDIIRPHIGIIFPATKSLNKQLLIGHIEQVLSGWSPFVIRLGGFHKSPDHWLFLTLQEGEAEVMRLNQELYSGYLAKYRKEPRKDGYKRVPHLGLGLFIKKGCTYDYRNPRDSDFDRDRYEEALCQAKALPLSSSILVDKLALDAIPEVLTEWTTGE
jgi:2'-5' RNA ligase superfamily